MFSIPMSCRNKPVYSNYWTDSFLTHAGHLEIHHPERKFDPSIFEFRVHSTTPKALERQTLEGVQIARSEADIILNSKSEFRQPAIHRVVTTREVDTNRRRGEN